MHLAKLASFTVGGQTGGSALHLLLAELNVLALLRLLLLLVEHTLDVVVGLLVRVGSLLRVLELLLSRLEVLCDTLELRLARLELRVKLEDLLLLDPLDVLLNIVDLGGRVMPSDKADLYKGEAGAKPYL